MTSFLSRFGSLIKFVVSGFDRQRFSGASRRLNNQRGVDSYIWQQNLRHADFPRHAEALTLKLRQQTEQDARAEGVPLVPLNHAQVDKEARALELAQAHGRDSGRIAVLSAVELCDAYRVRKDPAGGLRARQGTRQVPALLPLLPASGPGPGLRPHPELVPLHRPRRPERPRAALPPARTARRGL